MLGWTSGSFICNAFRGQCIPKNRSPLRFPPLSFQTDEVSSVLLTGASNKHAAVLSSLFRHQTEDRQNSLTHNENKGIRLMKNAHERFGKLMYRRQTEKTSTNLRVFLDAFVGEDGGKAHLVSVVGGDVEIGALAAAFANGDSFTVESPYGAESIVSLGEKPGTVNSYVVESMLQSAIPRSLRPGWISWTFLPSCFTRQATRCTRYASLAGGLGASDSDGR